MKRLSKIEKDRENKLKKKAKRYNKNYLGEMIHVDCKHLPLLEGQTQKSPGEYLFIAIDDFSRELFAAIPPDKTAASVGRFLEQILEECAYTVETISQKN